MTSIIGQLLVSGKNVDQGQSAILSHQKSYERLIDEEKLEVKARSLLRAEKRQKLVVGHVPVPNPSTYNHEKRLRKIATKGGKYGLSLYL